MSSGLPGRHIDERRHKIEDYLSSDFWIILTKASDTAAYSSNASQELINGILDLVAAIEKSAHDCKVDKRTSQKWRSQLGTILSEKRGTGFTNDQLRSLRLCLVRISKVLQNG